MGNPLGARQEVDPNLDLEIPAVPDADKESDDLGVVKPSMEADHLKKEDGFYLLLENGGKIVIRRPFE